MADDYPEDGFQAPDDFDNDAFDADRNLDSEDIVDGGIRDDVSLYFSLSTAILT